MTATIALNRAGIDVAVYERAPAFAEVGAGLSLWPNATRVLQSLGVLDAVVERGEPVVQFNLLRPDGNPIFAMPMTGFSTPTVCVHRADLHWMLRSRLPGECLRPNHRLVGFSQDAKSVSARFSSGLEVDADGLIASDGINSTVRSQIHGASEPIYRGYCIWRGITPEIPGAIKGHISETWGSGRRFGILPMGHGRVCWYATLNGPPSESGRAWGAEIRGACPVQGLAQTDSGVDRGKLRGGGNVLALDHLADHFILLFGNVELVEPADDLHFLPFGLVDLID